MEFNIHQNGVQLNFKTIKCNMAYWKKNFKMFIPIKGH